VLLLAAAEVLELRGKHRCPVDGPRDFFCILDDRLVICSLQQDHLRTAMHDHKQVVEIVREVCGFDRIHRRTVGWTDFASFFRATSTNSTLGWWHVLFLCFGHWINLPIRDTCHDLGFRESRNTTRLSSLQKTAIKIDSEFALFGIPFSARRCVSGFETEFCNLDMKYELTEQSIPQPLYSQGLPAELLWSLVCTRKAQ
jgi:hypothetical protein